MKIEFSIKTRKKEELIEITPFIQEQISKIRIVDGIVVVFVPHTTAGVTINENADPAVREDIIAGLRVIPESGYRHMEGNSPAHIKASIIGASEVVIIEGGRLALGTWQGIYFAEFDGPRQRNIWLTILGK